MKTVKICMLLLAGALIQSNVFAQNCRDINFIFKNNTKLTYQLQANKGSFPSTLPSGNTVGSIPDDSGISSLVLGSKNGDQILFVINMNYNTCASDQIGEININTNPTLVAISAGYNKENDTVTINIKNP